MHLIIDRFEGSFAVCEDENRQVINIERKKLPSEAKVGDVLSIDGDKIYINSEKTNARKKMLKKMMDNLWE